MGNSHSSEAPRKASHRLSKPRTNQRASTIGPLSPNVSEQSDSVRFSNAYQIGRPPSGVPPSPSTHIPEHTYTGMSETPSDMAIPAVNGSKERERRLSGIVRSNTFKQDYTPRHSMVAASVHSLEQQSRTRANSMVYGAGTRSLAGDYAKSLPSQSRRGSFHHEIPLPEPRSPMFRDMNIPQVPPLPTAQIGDQLQEGPDAVPSSPQMQAGSAAITRNNSDVSLYPPVRRRSIVQTPGVATRAPAPLISKPSYRRSLPPSPSMSRRNSIDRNVKKHNSMLPAARPVEFESREHVVTPCEDAYKQLGGIKFGSLRIVNGSPAPSMVLDSATEQSRSSKTDSSPNTAARRPAVETAPKLKIVHPKPTSAVTSPVLATFGELSQEREKPCLRLETSGVEMRQHHSAALMAHSPSRLTYPRLEVASKTTEYEDGLFEPEPHAESIDCEVIHVRDVPLARASTTSTTPQDTHKRTETVARSDSGFASTSSTTSGKPLSKTDSGYGSNLSLRSLRRSNSKPQSPSMPIVENQNHDSRREETGTGIVGSTGRPNRSLPPGGEGHQSRQPSNVLSAINFSSNPLGLSILKPSKSRDASMPNASLPGRRSRPRSESTQPAPEASTSTNRDSSTKQARLQRFWNSNRRKSLPAQSAPASYDLQEAMPQILVRSNVQDEAQDLVYAHLSTLRPEPSKDTLKTIMSVGSAELVQAQEATFHAQQRNISDHQVSPKTGNGFEAISSAPIVSVDEISRPLSRPGRKTLSKPARASVLVQSTPHQLKSRSSAPNFLNYDPSLPASTFLDQTARMGSKTPPPLSMRRPSTRNSTATHKSEYPGPSSRGLLSNNPTNWQNTGIDRRRTHSPIDEGGQSTYKSYPSSAVEPLSGTLNAGDLNDLQSYRHSHSASRRGSTGQHMSYDSDLHIPQTFVHNGRVVHVPNRLRGAQHRPASRNQAAHLREDYTHHFAIEIPPQQLGRVASNPSMSVYNRQESVDPRRCGYGQTPPYRVLHSYDSPAYRNTPIWN
ncbi:hypothetical protein HJFPF1_04860 [Paramyrothecium foliicola]|nr:hypothetical protein HJFPF1_04860 [Paramyrothecium foliicola]